MHGSVVTGAEAAGATGRCWWYYALGHARSVADSGAWLRTTAVGVPWQPHGESALIGGPGVGCGG
jgi:hypothetical protein